jgi:hypothetical protein
MNPFIISGEPHGTNNYSVSMGYVTLHFSYKTLIGVHIFNNPGTLHEASFRVHNAWGPTTGRHMKAVGLEHAQVRTEEELYEIVRGALFADVVAAPLNQTDTLKEIA